MTICSVRNDNLLSRCVYSDILLKHKIPHKSLAQFQASSGNTDRSLELAWVWWATLPERNMADGEQFAKKAENLTPKEELEVHMDVQEGGPEQDR